MVLFNRLITLVLATTFSLSEMVYGSEGKTEMNTDTANGNHKKVAFIEIAKKIICNLQNMQEVEKTA